MPLLFLKIDFFAFIIIIIIIIIIFVFVAMCIQVPPQTRRGLGIQAVVSLLTWMLGTKLDSSERTTNTLNH